MKKKFHGLMARIAGITLIEILVALGVLSILVAVAVPSMTGLLEKRRVIAAAEEILGILTYAKAETNSTNAILITRFDKDPNPDLSKRLSCAAVTFSPGMSRCKCFDSEAASCKGGGERILRLFQLPQTYVKFEAFADPWAAGAYQLRFSRDKMAVESKDFHVDIEGLKVGYKLSVELNDAGHARICMPADGKMSGYAKCKERAGP